MALGDSELMRPFQVDVNRFPIFLSYGREARGFKERLKRLIREAFDTPLAHDDHWRVQLPVWEWPDHKARKAPPGGKTNDIFVDLAQRSSVTIVLLIDRVPPGTEEELEAVLDDPQVELKVFWLKRTRPWWKPRTRATSVEKLMDKHRDDFSYVPLEDLDAEEAWLALTKNLVALLLDALYSEQRGARPYQETRQ